jgi:hypothetical protein
LGINGNLNKKALDAFKENLDWKKAEVPWKDLLRG